MKPLDALSLELGGTALIEASAGTGKTHTLTTLYLRLLVEEDLLPSDILVVTYTNAATAELRDRVRGRIREAIAAADAEARGDADGASRFGHECLEIGREARRRADEAGRPDALRRALREFDEAAIFTIHGFCQRVLTQHAFESGAPFDAELIEAGELLQQEMARDAWARGLAGEDAGFVDWLLRGAGRRWSFTPERIERELLALLGADEEMPVHPIVDASTGESASRSRAQDLAAQAATLRTAWVDWAKAWPAGRQRVEDWMLRGADLNRSRYRLATIETKWLPQLDAWCAAIGVQGDEGPVPALPDWWTKWTPGGLAKGMKGNGAPLVDPVFDDFAAVEAAARRLEGAYAARAVELRRGVVDDARANAHRRRSERHQLVFDDLLSELRAALRPPRGDALAEQLRRQYRFALIDEFQDTDPVQFEIFRRVWGGAGGARDGSGRSGLILIGDPKQAIYAFRGADLFTYLGAARAAGQSVYGLDTNHRSDPAVIAAVNALFERPARAFRFEEIGFRAVQPAPESAAGLRASGRSTAGLRVLLAEHRRALGEGAAPADAVPASAEDANGKNGTKKSKKKKEELPLSFGRVELMRAMANDIAALLESDAQIEGRPVAPSDIAILGRKKLELERARAALEAIGIPCVDRGSADVFDAREAWELLCVLRAMLRSGDESLLRAALATGAIGWNAKALLALGEESDELAAIAERYAEYGRIWRQSGFIQAFESWRRQERVTQQLLQYVDGERRLTNWLHLAELLQRLQSERAPSRSGLANWLERAIRDPDLRSRFGSEASLLRLESDEQAVSLLTLHHSKGLEYEIVYLPALWENGSSRSPKLENVRKDVKQKPPVRCHDPETDRRVLDLGGPDYVEHFERQIEEERSEDLRILYVGLTRARRQCVVLWGAVGNGAYASTPLSGLLAAADPELASLDDDKRTDEIRAWGDAGWRRAFGALAEAAGKATVSVEPASWEPRGRWIARKPSRPELVFEGGDETIPAARRTTSFSGLTRDAHRLLAPSVAPDAIGRDVDASVSSARADEAAESSDLEGAMDGFPRGADAGTLLHEVLESVDLANWTEVDVRASATRALMQHGLDPEHADAVLHVVRSVASTPLRHDRGALRLGDLAPGGLRPELEFTLVASPADGTRGLSPESLAERLARQPSSSPIHAYAARLERLSWSRLDGFLRGFIDAVLFDGERFFLLDYKSNHLGARQSDYMPEMLVAPMLEHDYVLQYLIYSVALDRYLTRTFEGYRYAEHFGGVYYLFLRGLAVAHPEGCGVFYDRPEEALIRDVSGLIGGDARDVLGLDAEMRSPR